MSTPVKEKTPLELRAERLLEESMRYDSDDEDEGLRERNHNEPLYAYFRRQVKAQINYHLDKHKKPVKRRRRMVGMTPSPTKGRGYDDVENEPISASPSPQKRSRSAKKLKVTWSDTPTHVKRLVSEELTGVVIPPVSESKALLKDFNRLHELLQTRQNVTEAAVAQIRAERKYLNQIKVTTARDKINLQCEEIEERNERLAQDLERQLMVLLDIGRCVDKIYNEIDADRAQIKADCEEELERRMEQEKEKGKTQHLALQTRNEDLRREVRGLKDASETIAQLERQIAEASRERQQLQGDLSQATEQVRSLTESVQAKSAQFTNKDMEVARLQSELDNMAGLLRATEDSHTSAAAQSESEIRALNEQIQLMRESEKVGIESLNQAKDREIQRLKEEIVRLQEELNIRIKTAHSDEERFNANLVELKHELNRLESRNQSLTVAENDEVRILKQALQDADAKFAAERAKFTDALDEKERYRIKQKNEWAEIYTGLKHEIKELKARYGEMTQESERLMRQLDRSQTEGLHAETSLKSQNDSLRARLGDKEAEAAQLWDALQDIRRLQNTKGKIDYADVEGVLLTRNIGERSSARKRGN